MIRHPLRATFLTGIITIGCLLPSVFAFAQEAQPTTPPAAAPRASADASAGYGFIDPLGSKTIPQILGGIVRAALGFVGAVFLLFFIWGGLLWMTSSGDTEKVKKAKASLRNAIFGLLVVFFSYLLVSAIIGVSSTIQSAPSTSQAANKKTP